MAQTPAYNRQFDFEDHSTNYPTTPQPGIQHEAEYDAIKATIDAVLTNIALIQRDDGELANSSVGADQLKSSLTLGLNPAGNWATATIYVTNDAVYESNKLYRCLEDHTSGVFATDLAATKWEEVVDFDQFLSAASASATAAATSASNAATSETNAGTSETNAAASETNAGTSETNAAASAAAAAASAASISLPTVTGADVGKHYEVDGSGDIIVALPTQEADVAAVDTGTATDVYVSPDSLAGSDFGIFYVTLWCTALDGDTVTGDGAMYYDVPAAMDGMNLVSVHAAVVTAGTTGTTDIQIHNMTNVLDMLSTVITIDSGETGSDTAATAAVINASNDHVNTNDVIRIDVDAVSTTAAQGLRVTLGFRKP